ncbi:MAG: transcriptional regulator NrdR [Candidatus Omnitrophota bacterium]|jgi:transcriptional repressor NrdR
MRCPYCKQENDKVIDSRSANEGAVIRRRRECEACGKRYTTYERIDEIPLYVIKKDLRREPYERAKVLAGVYKACEKRPIPLADQEKIADELEKLMREKYDKEIPSKEIGEAIMRNLARLDQVAYVRFASVYRDFQDISHFMKEIKQMIQKQSA